MYSLKEALNNNDFLILDGALGTEVESRGFNICHKLWSALCLIENPQLIYNIHLDYLRAGSDILTTSSYQASIQGLMETLGSDENEASEILRTSVFLAQKARETFWRELSEKERSSRTPILVGGDIGPYAAYLADGSEYNGQYNIDQSELENYHRRQISVLRSADCDFLILETIPNYIEVKALLNLLETEFSDMTAYLSVTTQNGINLTDGTPLENVAELCQTSEQILAIGVNCSSPHLISKALIRMRQKTDKPFVTYPNSGEVYDGSSKTWQKAQEKEESLQNNTLKWIEMGAKIVGGCCRTTPKDIATLSKSLKR